MSTKKRGKQIFKIQSYPRLMLVTSGGLAAATTYSGAYVPFAYFKPNDISMNLNENLALADHVQLNKSKEKDVRRPFRFLEEDAVNGFEEIFKLANRVPVTF